MSTQSIVALSGEKIIDNSKPLDWEHQNVLFYSYGHSNDLRINDDDTSKTCLVKDVKLYIHYKTPFWPLFPNFKIWNNTGLITDFNVVDFCSFLATNFT